MSVNFSGEVSKYLEELSNANIDDLVGERKLGETLSFKEWVWVFRNIQLVAELLLQCDIGGVPGNQIAPIKSHVKEVRDVYFSIRHFDATIADPLGARSTLGTALSAKYEQLFQSAVPIFAFAAISSPQVGVLERAKQSASEAINQIERYKIEAIEAAEASKRAAGDSGVATHAGNFKNAADLHEKKSTHWLWATGLLGVVGILATICLIANYWGSPPKMEASQLIQSIGAKALFFAFIFFGLAVCVRAYQAHRHNYIVNKHRQNALATFQAFASAAEDQQTKNAVLIAATQSIFFANASGHLPGNPDGQSSASILEIIKGVGDVAPKP